MQQTEPPAGSHPSDEHSQDEADLAAHGYRQRLNRRLGGLSAFAVGYSYLSILTGMFELFGFGYGFSGPTMFIAWLIVFVAQMAVALRLVYDPPLGSTSPSDIETEGNLI